MPKLLYTVLFYRYILYYQCLFNILMRLIKIRFGVIVEYPHIFFNLIFYMHLLTYPSTDIWVYLSTGLNWSIDIDAWPATQNAKFAGKSCQNRRNI